MRRKQARIHSGPRSWDLAWGLGLICLVTAVARTAEGQSTTTATVDKVWEYAAKCFERAEVDPTKLAGPFTCKNTQSKELFTRVNGVVKDLPTQTDFPTSCDSPAWLDGLKCYGNSYIQTIDTGTADVKAALLCRHKTVWTDAQTKFDDIAMIVHNKKNGQTCWFQTKEGQGVERDGTAVPGPATVRDHDFWLDAKATANIKCVRCHDSGPWMNSRWMYDAIKTLKDGKGAYVNEGDHFENWPKPVFVTVARFGLPKDKGKQCSMCHKIAAKDTGFRTCTDWIEFTTGRKHPPLRNAHGKASMDIAYWMPKKHREPDATAWSARYKAHVDKLVACCKAKGVGVAKCEIFPPKIRTTAPTRTSVQIEGSIDRGATFPYFASEPWQEAPVTYSVPLGAELTLRWGSPAEQYYCSLEATFPAGVSVNGVSTASNFSLDEGDPYKVIGHLYTPGDYRFDLICDQDGEPRAASIVFNVHDIAAPDAYLYLQTVVNGAPGDPASTNPGPTSTEDLAEVGDDVRVQWAAANVLAGSCDVEEVLRGSAFWVADSGDEPTAIGDPGDRKYVLACTGLDGLQHAVDVTLRVDDPTANETNLLLRAIVDGDVGDEATIVPGPESVTDDATVDSTVVLEWTSSNVQPESCTLEEVLRNEGSWHADWGSQNVSFPDAGDRRYVLSCVGIDGLTYDVDLLLRVGDADDSDCQPVPWMPVPVCDTA